MTGQHVVGQGAQGEHVQPNPVRVAVPYAFGCLERLGQPPVHVHGTRAHHRARLVSRRAGAISGAHQAGDPAAGQPGQRRSRHRARALPVPDQDPHPALRQGADRDGMRRQPAVHHSVPVRVRDRLGDLAQQFELCFCRHAARMVGQPQVEPLEPVIERVHQADAEFAVHHVPRAQQPLVRQPRHDPVFMLGDLPDLGPRGGRRTRRSDQEADPAPVGGGHPVERRPVLPAVTFPERILVDHPGAGLTLPALDDSDPRHQRGDDLVAVRADGLLGRGRLQQPLRDAGQAGAALAAVQAEQVYPGGGRQQAPDAGVVQEDGLLDERHYRASIGDGGAGLLRPADQLILQLAGQPLRLAPGELERGVFGAVTVAPPGQVVTAQGAGVVLQLHQVQPAPAQHQQVHLVPLAVAVAELEVRPGPERRVGRQQGPDEVEPLDLMGELRGGHLTPALNRPRHGPVSSRCPQGILAGRRVPKVHLASSCRSGAGMRVGRCCCCRGAGWVVRGSADHASLVAVPALPG